MIDNARRQKLAFHLRQLSVGIYSNDDFEEAVADDVTNGWLPEQYYRSEEAKSDDPIIQPMLELCWGLYNDTRKHKLIRSNALSDEVLKVIARCILFLRSGREYEWTYLNAINPVIKFSLKEIVISLLTLGFYYRSKRKEQLIDYDKWQRSGDFEVWPFLRQKDYEEQLEHHPFLAGRVNNVS